jgi:SAM-dependent methyltransferase/aminoglycoside phosphotransferase (APT) family kinase protein
LRLSAEGDESLAPLGSAARASVREAVDAMARGEPFKASLEALLLALPEHAALKLMELLRENRGAWFPLLACNGGRALFLGNALSGTPVALAMSGFAVTFLERDPERARLAFLRNEVQARGCTFALLGGDGARLPFPENAFDLVVLEGGMPARRGFALGFSECARVCGGELVLIADNRFAYKHSRGLRGDFHIPGPLAFARRALAPSGGERTLRGYRQLLREASLASVRSFALYPHRREFSQIVALDDELPALAVGPRERENRIKVAARSLGLFPLFTPSFALIGSRAPVEAGAPRFERILDELAQRIGEQRPRVEQFVATRNNAALLLTAPRSSDPEDPGGRWAVHLALGVHQIRMKIRHFAFLQEVEGRFPDVPVPRPLFQGAIDGVLVTAERRLEGLTATQFTGVLEPTRRLLDDLVRVLPLCALDEPETFSAEDFEGLIEAKFELVSRFVRTSSTRAWLETQRASLRDRLVGRRIPRVLSHADVRPKHIQVDSRGNVIGLLDWSSSERRDLPYYDLGHLLIHQRKQEANLRAGDAWRLVMERRELREHERAALDQYAATLQLDPETRAAIEGMYPVLVAAVAERSWDYSRPHWLARNFQI